MRNAYIAALHELAKENKNILALVADNGAIVYDQFRKDCGEQFINVGISEATMVTVAAGLAACQKIPFIYTIATFLTMRAYEQIRNDVGMQNMNVKVVGIGGGFGYSNLGPTHHACEDLALMMLIPNMTVFSPLDPIETIKATRAAAAIQGPVYLRLAVGNIPKISKNEYDFNVGKGVVLHDGKDVSVISTGYMAHEALKAAQEFEQEGISVRLIHLHTLKPIDREIIAKAAAETKAILTVEEHMIIGGLGSEVASVILEEGYLNRTQRIKFKRMGLKAYPDGYGSYDDMRELNGLSVKYIKHEIKKLIEREGR